MNMDFQRILKKIAKENHTTPEDVYHEMQVAIDAAFNSKDPEVQKNWRSITFEGDRPTPEDVIYNLGMMLSPDSETKH